MYTTVIKLGDSIKIGEATVKILEISRGKIRLGVAAPRSVTIRRSQPHKLPGRKDLPVICDHCRQPIPPSMDRQATGDGTVCHRCIQQTKG